MYSEDWLLDRVSYNLSIWENGTSLKLNSTGRSHNTPIFAMTSIISYLSIIHFEKSCNWNYKNISNLSFPSIGFVLPNTHCG